jgi:putative peptidoglycan lipid II flippase
VIVISLPAAASLAILAVPLLATMFNYREFTSHDVLMSADALQAYAIGLVGLVFVKVLAPGFFARQNTATPVRIGIIAMIVNVLVGLSLVFWLAHVGLALATSIAAMVNALMLGIVLRRDGVLVLEAALAPLLLRVLVATAVMSVVLVMLSGPAETWLDAGVIQRVGRLVICVVSGLIAYALVLWIVGTRPKHLSINDA